MGYPNSRLIEISKNDEFKEAMKNWETKFKNRSISPPPIIEKSLIALKPHHAILYSETCRRIAKDINNKLYEELGEKFFVEKTIKKHLVVCQDENVG